VEARSRPLLPQYTPYELSEILFGVGRLVAACRTGSVCSSVSNSVSSEWVDLFACQCLDVVDQMSTPQLLSALRGLMSLRHPGVCTCCMLRCFSSAAGSRNDPAATAAAAAASCLCAVWPPARAAGHARSCCAGSAGEVRAGRLLTWRSCCTSWARYSSGTAAVSGRSGATAACCECGSQEDGCRRQQHQAAAAAAAAAAVAGSDGQQDAGC